MEQFFATFFIFIKKSPLNLVLFGLAVTSAGMLLFPLFTRGVRTSAEVGATEAVMLINRKDAIVLDVRDEGEFASGHINSARHVPEKQLADRMKELEKFKNKPVIVSCASGRRAATVAGSLRKQGFTDIVALRGGIAAWQQAGMPLEK
ncbi:MAG TPA: rhodanese-like domain-containing protein [Burkholderiales bacterium]|nr:rhodanese-like domain-containing protein [Burkholderiales bacterium]